MGTKATWKAGDLTPEEAHTVLTVLLERRPTLRKEVGAIIAELGPTVDLGEVAASVLFDLKGITVEDVWRDSGEDRYGYTDPLDAADALVQAIVDEHLEAARRLEASNRPDEADTFLAGIVVGLNRYERTFEPPIRDYLEESPRAFATMLLHGWRKRVLSESRAARLAQRLAAECEGWEDLVASALG